MKLLLVGCGNIGSALLRLWVSSAIFESIIVVQPSMSQAHNFSAASVVHFVKDLQQIPSDFVPDLLVLAIKPQSFDALISDLAHTRGSIVVSVLSGISINALQVAMQSNRKIIRIMPNVAIKTGLSLNLAYANQNFTASDNSTIENIFGVSGKMLWLSQENLLDALTPISGSGPAYFFLLAEILANAAVAAGIEIELAQELSRQVLIGSASLAAETTDFETLRNSVTSKGGITEAALKIMIPGFNSIVADSLKQAWQRVSELKNEES